MISENGNYPEHKAHKPIFIITGEPGEGKTTLLTQTLCFLGAKGIRYSGILAPGKIKNGTRYGFSVKDLWTGKSVELCNKENRAWIRHGPFYFNPDGVFHGKNALLTSEKVDQDLVVIDEIGRFELNGEVWAESVDRLRSLVDFPMIWVVRKSLLEAVIQRWNVKNSFVFEVRKDRPSLIAEKITNHLSSNPSVLGLSDKEIKPD